MPGALEVLRRSPVRVDAVAVALLGLPLVLIGTAAELGLGPRTVVVSTGAGLGMVLPLIWRRVAPGLVLVLVCAVGGLQLSALTFPLPADAAFAVALYTVSARPLSALTRWAVLGVGLGAAVLCAGRWGGYAGVVPLGLVVILAVISGRLRHVRAAYVEGLVERAEGAENEREQQLRLAQSAERARIAREMHDVVAHSLSVIIVQADGGAYVADQDPERAREVLRTIGATGREALTQMRHLLGVLREEPGVPAGLQTSPEPGLRDLPELIRRTAATGLPLHSELPDPAEVEDVLPGTGLVAYRVVQESLTNVLKHAGMVSRVEVGVERIGERLRIEVRDDGRGPAPGSGPGSGSASGHGLAGMRERVALLGGRLVAGARPGGGFQTVAILPAPTTLPAGRTLPAPTTPQAPAMVPGQRAPGQRAPGQAGAWRS